MDVSDETTAEWRRFFTEQPTEPGWTGIFTRHEAAGAIPNGERIVKATFEEGDSQPIGAPGTVLGSLPTMPAIADEAKERGIRPPDAYWYFIEWDARPRWALSVVDWKIRRADGG
jgi:hypothetical protein